LEAGHLTETVQSHEGVIYAKKISNDDSRIDWQQPAQNVHDLIRGLSPFPGAFALFDFGKGEERVKILQSRMVNATGPIGHVLDSTLTIACGSGAVQLLRLQRAGNKAMTAEEFLRGHPIQAGARFS